MVIKIFLSLSQTALTYVLNRLRSKMAILQKDRLLQVFTPFPENFLVMKRLHATEGLSQLFRYELELLHEEADKTTSRSYKATLVNPKDILGKPIVVQVGQRDSVHRYFTGIVSEFTNAGRDVNFSYYYATLVPEVWLLTQNVQSRIFQHIPIPEILKKVFDGFNVKYEIQGNFHPRDYCVQYRESDWDFASRLMQEEGIYYYFEHTNNTHKMIVANTPQSHRDCPSKSELPYYTDVSRKEDFIGSVGSFQVGYRFQTGKITLWDHCFELPGKKLEAQQPTRFTLTGKDKLETYDYPGLYAQRFDGIDKGGGERPSDLQKIFEDNRRTAQIRMQEIDTGYQVGVGMSDCCSFTAGHRFQLQKHPNDEYNKQYVITSVSHEAVQSPDYVSNEEVARAYNNSFECILQGEGQAPFRPPRVTKRPTVLGCQTAVVVGPAGEEIFTDKYGRIKVQFHWDREGQNDSGSSCWIRVAQSWAGKRWGMMFIPRIGMEVIVDFLEGDPDQPICVGCVYNADTMPPYTLPDEKTKMTVKSDSSKGGGGFNEIRFEDKKGSEQVFLHGEKDQDIRIKNDRREWIGRDRNLIVKRDKKELVERDEHIIIKRDLVEKVERDHNQKIQGKVAIEVTQSVSRKVTGNVAEEFGANVSQTITGFQTVKAKTIVLEADMAITLKAGGSSININPGGIQIIGSPMLMLNSGGSPTPGMPGTLVPPQDPMEAEIADNADPGSKAPTYKNQRAAMTKREAAAFNAPSFNPKSKKNKDKTHWIGIKLVDKKGKPVAGEKYRVTLPDGTTLAEGTLDEKGEAKVTNIDPGNCKVTFPNLDKNAVKEK
jgi:type VI secretion system secreted protein VgrG